MEHNEVQGKKVVHLQIGDDHSYYGSIAQLFEDYTAEQLGISYFKTKNNLKAKGVITTDRCIIRQGVLRTKKKKH